MRPPAASDLQHGLWLRFACFTSADLLLQRLKPEFEAAAKRLKEIDDNIVLANVRLSWLP